MASRPSSIESPGFRPFKWALTIVFTNAVLNLVLLALEHQKWLVRTLQSDFSLAFLGAEVVSLAASLLLFVVAIRRGSAGIRTASIVLAIPVIMYLALIAQGPD